MNVYKFLKINYAIEKEFLKYEKFMLSNECDKEKHDEYIKHSRAKNFKNWLRNIYFNK